MNYRIEAIDVLLNYDCVLSRYFPLIPYKGMLIDRLVESDCLTKEQCLALSNDCFYKIGLQDAETVNLLRSFLVMYDIKPQKLKEINKVCFSDDEIRSFNELYMLPGVKCIRARLYYEAGYRYLADIAVALPQEIIDKTSEAIIKNDLTAKAPLLKEVKTHIAVAKAHTFFKA